MLMVQPSRPNSSMHLFQANLLLYATYARTKICMTRVLVTIKAIINTTTMVMVTIIITKTKMNNKKKTMIMPMKMIKRHAALTTNNTLTSL
jgi:hypothetical protein